MDERQRAWAQAAGAAAAVLVVTAIVLMGMGRVWWCGCGQYFLWSGDIWTRHNSQHIADAYTFSHILHGVVFYGMLHMALGKRLAHSWRFGLALVLEASWEILENTDRVIQHYRETTISLDYYGDSVANSMADILWCGLGYGIALAIPWWGSAGFFVATELFLLAWIRDSLLLNVIMLVYPLEFIKQWQMGGG